LPFTGEFHHTIDAKGRLIIPSRLRDEVEDSRVVLTPWAEGCIALWSGPGWSELEATLLRQRRSNRATRAAVRRIATGAHLDVVDRQGRITLPAALLEHAGLRRDAVVVGNLDHGEIWSPERWAAQQPTDADDFDRTFEQLDL
jgi:MraZ protein